MTHIPNYISKIKLSQKNFTSYGLLAPCQNLEKTYIKIQWKPPDKQKDRWKGGQNLSFRILLATARNPKWISKRAYLKKPLSLSELMSSEMLQLCCHFFYSAKHLMYIPKYLETWLASLIAVTEPYLEEHTHTVDRTYQ